MKRNIIRKLQDWKTSKNRNPLILKGVRQCGKSHSLETFGRSHFSRHFIINFEENRQAHSIFEANLSPKQLLSNLSFHLQTDINPRTDLLIFDEIQACPNALTSLKYFSEKMPDLAICAAGSLLGLALSPASFPVGKVDFLTLHPMSFCEFLMALEDKQSLDILEACTLQSSIPKIAHTHIWERFKWYLITGGLPEVVKTFIDQKEQLYSAFQAVRIKQKSLINAYYADIAKHSGKVNATHIERIFESVPRQLAKTQNTQAPRFQFSNIVPGADRYQHLSSAIDWLNKAGLVLQNGIVNHIEMPLPAYLKTNLFKLYCFDIGLLGAMNELAPKTILEYDYGGYKGYMAENFVMQQLTMTGKSTPCCWQKDRSEIEFVEQISDRIIPIEVKAGHITRAKSLEKYQTLYEPSIAIIMSGREYGMDLDNQRLYCPLYMAEWLPALLANA